MAQSLKKMAAVLITISMLMAMPVYAASEQKEVLKLEAAVQSALGHSSQVSLNSKEYDLLKEQLKAIEGGSFVEYQTIYLTKTNNAQQAEFIKDQITYDISKRYNDIVLTEKYLEKLKTDILLSSKKLEVMKTQKTLGYITPFAYEKAVLSLENLEITQNAKMESLENDRSYFKVLTGRDLSNYTLDDTLNFEVFRIPGNVESHINNKIDIQLQYSEEIAKLIEDNLIKEGDAPMSWAVYLQKKYSADKSISDLEDARKKLKQGLTSTYSSLLNLEEQIGSLKMQLQIQQKDLEVAKQKYQTGFITALQYDEQTAAFKNIEYNLQSLINQYNMLKMVIEKPWSVTSSSS